MEAKINIEDYLSEEEIKEECRSAIRERIFAQYREESELERLISNLSYEFLFKQISEVIGEDSVKLIKSKVTELLHKDDTIKYELFRKADAWQRSESVGNKILQDAIKENEPLIKQRVKEIFDKYDFGDKQEIHDTITDCVYNYVTDKLFKKD